MYNSVDNLESGQGITLYMERFSSLLRIKRENWKNISSLLISFLFFQDINSYSLITWKFNQLAVI
ncbi:MAG: hypothetical protein D3910_09170 [Candidatus Electrothrix sp. ATG2]|nr:hypothetical protein [Candidatus Electrothrix sp. ATG2]